MTLLDLGAATARALHATNETLGVRIDVDDILGDLGVPFREQLTRWVDPKAVGIVVRTFHTEFMTTGLDTVTRLPGATEAVSAVQRSGGFCMVATGRRRSVGLACLRRADLAVPVVVGGVFGEQKSSAIREHGVDAYVGDHVLDMRAARSAGIPGIGVETGPCTSRQLLEAGAAAVVSSLEEVAAWLTPG